MEKERALIIEENVREVMERVRRAAESRSMGKKVKVLLATKTVCPEEILYAASLTGDNCIGENKVTELTAKYEEVKNVGEIHFIGHLQTNKVKNVVGKVDLIESLDSLRLAAEIDKVSAARGIVSDVLVEINIGEEEAKGGIMPDEVEKFFEDIAVFEHIRPVGIMTMAPKCDKKEDYRRYFRKTYAIFLDISKKYLYNIIEPVLSMGMSDSYEEAILEGATLVRVGSAVFGKRNYVTAEN